MDRNRRLGKIKWFNPDKDYGFLVTEEETADVDIFFHRSEFKIGVTPQQDQIIEFRLALNERPEGESRLRAVDCVVITMVTEKEQKKIEAELKRLEEQTAKSTEEK